MVIHALQHNGAGGGGAGVYKVDTIKLVIAGKSIGVDLRGAALPTPKPRPHMTILWHPDGFSAADLQKVSEITTAWCYARNIGVLSRVVAFTLEEMDPDEVCRSPEYADKQPVGFEGEISTVVRVAGELAEFFEYIQYTFPTWNAGLDVPHLDLLLYS